MIFQTSFRLASSKIIGQTHKFLSSFLKKLPFPISKVKKEKGFPEEQQSLVIMDILRA